MNTEHWKEVAGYEGLYMVSSHGRVLSLRTGKLRKLVIDTRLGYVNVVLSGKGGNRSHKVHRLVASAFIDNPSGLSDVNHKNFIRGDNTVENLEWLSHKENCIQSAKAGRIGKLTRATVSQIRESRESGESFSSISRRMSIPLATVFNAATGVSWNH